MDMIKEFDKKRVEYNKKIHELISNVIINHPYLRYNQIMTILECDQSKFYEEPWETYERLLTKKKKIFTNNSNETRC